MAEEAISWVPAMSADLTQYKTKITGYLNTALGMSALNQSIGQLCGIDLEPNNPVIEDLEYFTARFRLREEGRSYHP
jgi:hypothetical protein